MATDFTIKQGDRLPEIQATLKDATGVAVNVIGASVKFLMKSKTTGLLAVNGTAVLVNAGSGVVKYAWGLTDTATPDTYQAEWEVVFGDGRVETFPNATYLNIKVLADLGGVVG